MSEDKQQLIENFKEARRNFLHYVMKVTYGPIEDINYNTKEAIAWNKIIKQLRDKIINYDNRNM